MVRSTFRSQNAKSTTCSRHFWTLKRRFVWQAQGILHLAKGEQNVGVLWHIQNNGRCGTFEEDLQGFRVAGAVQETCSSEMLRGVAFWSIRSSGLLRLFCVTGAALRMARRTLFHGRRSTLSRWNGQIATHWPEAAGSPLNFPIVSQDCFVVDVVNLKNGGSLAE